MGERVRKHCRDQRFLASTEPLDIYPDFKQALLAAQRDLDAAMARYESSRPWILLVMWGWALFELVGCYWGLKFARQDIRRWKQMRSRGKPDEPAPS